MSQLDVHDTACQLEVRKTACNRDCPDACGIVALVENERVVRLQGDPDHPVTQGFLCHRTSRFLERQYSPDRITSPLMRVGGDFQPVAWDVALDRITQFMLRVKRESGPAAILHYRCGGSLGIMKHVTDYFFERFGPVTTKSGDVCSGAGDAAQMADFGDEDSHDIFDVLNSRTIVLWGKNVTVSSVHLVPILRQAKERGARLVLIDPVYHRTVHLCDLYVQPRPAADAAIAMGMARILLDEKLHDPQAAEYCDHFDQFCALARSRSVAQWAQQADVTAAQIQQLAAAYADGPAAILIGWGLQRRANGSATVRAIDALAAISGNLGVAGGGVSFYYRRRGAFDLSFAGGESAAPRTIPEPLLGPGIVEAQDPPIRMVWVTAANPVDMLPQSLTVAEALRSRELTVVVDSFLTDTARCAHFVLPTTTMLEDDDLVGAYGHHWLSELRPVVQPPSGVKSDYQIVQQLASRLGMDGEFTRDVSAWKERLWARVHQQGIPLDQLRRGPVKNPFAQQVLFRDRKFSTSTGRVQLIRQLPAGPPQTTPQWPLLLMARSTESAQGSQWVLGADTGPLVATVHPDSAAGLKDGQLAYVESELGRIIVRLKFDARQRRDVLLAPKGGHLQSGRCANALIPARESDAGGCAVFYDTPVRIAPAEITHYADPNT